MDALETLVRDTLADHAHDAPPDATLLDSVTGRRSRFWPLISLAAAVIIAAAAVAIRAPWHNPPAGSSSAADPGVAAPAEYRWLTFSGIAITVPNDLPLRRTSCVPPAEYILEETPRSPVVSCAVGGVPETEQTVTVVLEEYSPRGTIRPDSNFTSRTISVHGIDGRIGYGTRHPFPGAAGELALPDQRVRVNVTAPTRAQVETILLSARPAADLLGCATQLRPDREPKIVPFHPVNADACVYSAPKHGVDTRSLVAARRLTGAKLDRILEIDRDFVMRAGLTNVDQRFVAVTLHYAARRDVILGFLSGEAADLITSP